MSLDEVGLAGLEALAPEWNALAAKDKNPFITTSWLACWARAFAHRDSTVLVLKDREKLLAGGCFTGSAPDALSAAANSHTNDWDIVAVDEQARGRFWEELVAMRSRRLTIARLADASGLLAAARDGGYRIAVQREPPSPWMQLPSSMDELLKARSRNLRSQVGRRRRALEKEGRVTFRVTADGPLVERDLERFFAVEASGWKGRAGTAITASGPVEGMYRGFAARAARSGLLRLYLLELDGETVAAAYGCAFEGGGYLIKSGFREDFGHLAPGFVLRVEILRASIEEGLGRYDFLGEPTPHKLRWADELRGRSTVRAFLGARHLPSFLWWSRFRPTLKALRDRGLRS